MTAVPIPGAHEMPHSAETLAQIARDIGFDARDTPGVAEALGLISALPKGQKRVMICGSLYLAGHVLGLQQGVIPQSN